MHGVPTMDRMIGLRHMHAEEGDTMTNDLWHRINHIPGWLSRVEAECLQRYAMGKVCLEIGAYCGRSTVTMGLVANYVVSIDHHKGDEGTGPADTYGVFLSNILQFFLINRVSARVGDVEQVGPTLGSEQFDMAFVDGAHDEASVARDLALSLRVVRPGGRILLHDRHYPGVIAAMRTHGVEAVEVAGSIAVCERR